MLRIKTLRWITRRNFNTLGLDRIDKEKDRVYVAMSGGVDSTVTAYLIKEQGFKVTGIFMKNWDQKEDETSETPCEMEWKKVQGICQFLDIPCQQINFVKQYWTHVFENTLLQYQLGMTPNPDVWCNREIKFDQLVKYLNIGNKSNQNSRIWIATGHYAKLKYEGSKVRLFQAEDKNKDQTYYLSNLRQEQLKNILFPLGHYKKHQVKEIARNIGLNNIADQQESMGICFVGKKKKFSEFLNNYLTVNLGDIITIDKEYVDKHDGLWSYTLGQRIRVSFKSKKYYVIHKDIENNQLIVAPNRDHPLLYKIQLIIQDFHWIQGNIPKQIQGFYYFKTRSTMPSEKCYLSLTQDQHLNIQFLKPVRAIAPGQFFVLYSIEGECLGSAIIR